MTKLPSVSVVVPTYNRADIVARTLEHLDAQHYPADLVEVLVVDNSTDDTPALVQQFAERSSIAVRLVAVDARLPAVKRNIGVAESDADLMFFINDDVWFSPDAIAEHVRVHRQRAEPTAVLGRVDQSAAMPATPFIEAYEPFAYHELDGAEGATVPYRYFWTMNLTIPRREMVERNLLFHEDWAEIGHEDVELGYRWTKAGRQIVYNPRAWGEHYHPHTVDSACRLQASVGRGLRDLEVLIPEPDLLERYGVFSLRHRPSVVARQALRTALFNRGTVPFVQAWLASRTRNSIVSRWMYWKVLLHHTTRAYHETAPRRPTPRPILPPARPEAVAW